MAWIHLRLHLSVLKTTYYVCMNVCPLSKSNTYTRDHNDCTCTSCAHVYNCHAVLHISHVALPGCSLYDSVITLVLGRNGMWPSRDTRRANLFRSKEHTLSDDAGESLGQPDFGREVYEELVGIYTSPSDWILNLSITSGKCMVTLSLHAYRLAM